MRISDWSSDVCSSDLFPLCCPGAPEEWLRHRSCRHASLRTDRVGKTGRPFGNVARAKTNDHVAGFKLLAELFRQIVRILSRRGGMMAAPFQASHQRDRKRVVAGTSVAVRVDHGGRRSIKKKKKKT